LDTQRSSIFRDALENSVQDALQKQSALSGLEGQLSGEEANQRGEQRTERGYNTDVDTGNVNRGLSTRTAAANLGSSGADAAINNARSNVGTLSALEQTARGANDNAVADLRNERNFQVGQEDSAYNRQLQQLLTEHGFSQDDFNNNLKLLGAGETGNPSGAIADAARTINPGLDAQTIAQLASGLGKKSVGGAAGGGAGGGSITGNPEIDKLLTQFISQKQNTGAAATAGQGIDIQKLLAMLSPADKGVQTTPGGGY
ncbi:MAG: hypothetical protein ACREBE_14790, partial [bacterium]